MTNSKSLPESKYAKPKESSLPEDIEEKPKKEPECKTEECRVRRKKLRFGKTSLALGLVTFFLIIPATIICSKLQFSFLPMFMANMAKSFPQQMIPIGILSLMVALILSITGLVLGAKQREVRITTSGLAGIIINALTLIMSIVLIVCVSLINGAFFIIP